MNALLIGSLVGMAVGYPDATVTAMRDVAEPLAGPCVYQLEFVEIDGVRRKGKGRFELREDGTGSIETHPFAKWTILSSNINKKTIPWTIDLQIQCESISGGRAKDYGICRISNGRLWLCLGLDGRPTDFTTKAQDCRFLMIYK